MSLYVFGRAATVVCGLAVIAGIGAMLPDFAQPVLLTGLIHLGLSAMLAADEESEPTPTERVQQRYVNGEISEMELETQLEDVMDGNDRAQLDGHGWVVVALCLLALGAVAGLVAFGPNLTAYQLAAERTVTPGPPTWPLLFAALAAVAVGVVSTLLQKAGERHD